MPLPLVGFPLVALSFLRMQETRLQAKLDARFRGDDGRQG
jgi:hypothetical protein